MRVFIDFWKLETKNSFLHVFNFLHKLSFENSFCFLSILVCQTSFLVSKIKNYFWKQKIRRKNSYHTYPKISTSFFLFQQYITNQQIYIIIIIIIIIIIKSSNHTFFFWLINIAGKFCFVLFFLIFTLGSKMQKVASILNTLSPLPHTILCWVYF